MSHHIESNGVHFNFDGDFSGSVRIVNKDKQEMTVPCESLLDFAGECLRRKKIRDLEGATAWEVLRGVKP